MAIASSLLQAIKKCRQACQPGILMRFSQGSIPESLVKKIKIDTVIQHWLKITTLKEYKNGFNKHLITLPILNCFSPNFQGLILKKKRLN